VNRYYGKQQEKEGRSRKPGRFVYKEIREGRTVDQWTGWRERQVSDTATAELSE